METQAIVNQFVTGIVVKVEPFGNGHINETLRITMQSGKKYLLQRINNEVFKDVAGMMQNIQKVTQHIISKGKKTLQFIPTSKGEYFYKTPHGIYWRAMDFEENTKSYETTDSHKIAESTGHIIADFQIDISDLNPDDFVEVIPSFHSLEYRLQQLDDAIVDNKANRLGSVKDLIEYSYTMRGSLLAFYEEKEIPLRITHNDTKLNNILFTNGDEPFCLVDLDTIMPGFIHYDFGDVVRTMCNTAEEDEKDLSKVKFSQSLYKSYKKGYLNIASKFLTEKEKEWLDVSGKLMTYIMAVRFLTDYINGDVYYKINYPMHNYDRANCQFKLLKEMCKVM